MQQELPLSRIARLKCFFQSTHVRRVVMFNMVFVCGGYLLWGTAEVGTIEWLVDECGHVLWSGFHMWIGLSYHKLHHAVEFEFWRWKEERILWLRIIFFSVFLWEGIELFHDISGFFTSSAQVGNSDTMTDILLSGVVAPLLVISYRRWTDGVSLLFTAARVKEANEHDFVIVYKALCRIAERNVNNEPHMISGLRELMRKEWVENHRVRLVIKNLYNIVVRGSRRERRQRRAFLKRLKDHTI